MRGIYGDMLKAEMEIKMKDFTGVIVFIVLGIMAAFAVFVPLITHVMWCISKADQTGSAIALLIVGLVVPPVGWVHGVALFLGYTWI